MPRESEYKTAVVIVAAGLGLRFDNRKNKQYSPIAGHPVLAWTVNAFFLTPCIDHIVVVVSDRGTKSPASKTGQAGAGKYLLKRYNFFDAIHFVNGGSNRQESVYNGLSSLPPGIQLVAIHDGARPAVTSDFITSVCKEAQSYGAAISAIHATNSTFIAEGNTVVKYLERDVLWQAQTPQVFKKEAILSAHMKAREEYFFANDDGTLYRRYIGEVRFVQGCLENVKITYPGDLILAEEILTPKTGQEDYPSPALRGEKNPE